MCSKKFLFFTEKCTRIISIVISTVLACYGQILFLQNVGTINTCNSHEQAGIVLFHLMFVVSPMAGQYLVGDAQMGEFFLVFVSKSGRQTQDVLPATFCLFYADECSSGLSTSL